MAASRDRCAAWVKRRRGRCQGVCDFCAATIEQPMGTACAPQFEWIISTVACYTVDTGVRHSAER